MLALRQRRARRHLEVGKGVGGGGQWRSSKSFGEGGKAGARAIDKPTAVSSSVNGFEAPCSSPRSGRRESEGIGRERERYDKVGPTNFFKELLSILPYIYHVGPKLL